MSFKKILSTTVVVASVLATASTISRPALADTLVDSSSFIDVTLSAPGAQTANLSNLLNPTVATFDNLNAGFYTSSCAGLTGNVTCYSAPSGISTNVGTFDQAFIQSANQYGGAGGTGKYFDVDHQTAGYSTDTQSTLTLKSAQKYLGLWWSAGDSYNVVQFYNGDTMLGSYQTSNVVNYIQNTNGQGYYGNPNSQFAGQDQNEPFAYLNFYATGNNQFTKLVFTNNGGTGFEVDNITLAKGYKTNQVPEASSTVGLLMIAGLGLLSQRKRIFG